MADVRIWRICIAIAAVTVLAAACSSGSDHPRIDGTLPSSARSQSETFLMIQGDNFARNAEARLGTSPLAGVTWINARLLTAQLPTGLRPGQYAVTVANPGSGETTRSGAFTVEAAPTTTAPAPAPSSAPQTAPPAQTATQPPVRTATATATASPVPSPSPAVSPSPAPPPRTAVPVAPPTAPATVPPTPLPAQRSVLPPVATRSPEQPQFRSVPSADLSGQWMIVDIVTNGPGIGGSYPFAVTIEQSGSTITGRGDGLNFSGTIDGQQVHVDYVQSNGSGGSFDWLLDPSGNVLAGAFTNSIGNGGNSLGRRADGGLIVTDATAPVRSIVQTSGSSNGRARKKER